MRTKFAAALLAFSLIASLFSTVQAQDQNQYPVYVIQSGDTLASIADQFGISLNDLISANNITDPNFVSVGSQLIIPGLSGISGQIAVSPVQLGENLHDLLVRYPISQTLLLKLNDVTSPGQIYAGATLILPVVDEAKAKLPISKVDSTQTLLETAALASTTTWNLLAQNNFTNYADLVAGDLLYATKSDSAKEISPVDTGLTSVTINPLPLVQGQTFEITVDCPQSVQLSGILDGHSLVFFPLEGTKQVALQGINGMADTGLTTFTLKGTYADGSTFSSEEPVLLVSGDYPVADPLTVDPATIDPKITQPEDEMIEKLTAVITPERYWSGEFISPDKNYGFATDYTALYGERRSYNDGALKTFHTGVDFGGGVGSPITAPADGKVVFASGPLTVRGNATVIDHGWGIYTAYYHQSEIDVKVGDMVKAGQIIGKVGNTGRVEDAGAFVGAGAHLHFEVWVNGVQVDPLQWLGNQYP
jgi:murein DD-endopeptidase MepM/ murein hydrolase activator NlpD